MIADTFDHANRMCGRVPLAVERTKPIKLAEQLAAQIEREILDQQLQPGHHLGTEADLLGRFKVSRSVLREALTLVEQSGLAEVLRGTVGGLVVRLPSPEMIAEPLCNYLELETTDWDDFFTTRRALEELALAAAASRLREADVAGVIALIDQFDRTEHERDFVKLQLAYLQHVHGLAANPCLTVFSLAMSQLFLGRLASYPLFEKALLRRARELCGYRRDELVAVLGLDKGAAAEACSRYYEALRQTYEAAHCATLEADSPEPVPSDEDESVVFTLKFNRPTMKLAAVVAGEITSRIAREGLQSGDRLGSEADLLRQFQVGRGVMREAIRILERLSVVRPVRGKGGGLYYSAPRPDVVVSTVAAHIRSLAVSYDNLVEVGGTLELMGVGMAAQRAARQGVTAAELQERIDRFLAGAPPRAAGGAWYRLSGELSGNGPLSVLLAILARLLAEYRPEDELSRLDKTEERRLALLVEAVAAGDPALARRRMLILRRRDASAAHTVDRFVRKLVPA